MQLPLLALWASAQSSIFSFSSTWEVLGPFQIGTREAEWGADPLEKLGGFRNLTFSPEAVFPSALPINGVAKWNTTSAVVDVGTARVGVAFENVDWNTLRSVYGWSGIQYQAWARGSLEICGTVETAVVVYINNVGEFWIDNVQYFGGDFYGYRRAPVVVKLKPGRHKVDVRVTHDIRNFGGGMPPVLSFTIEAHGSKEGLVAVPENAVVPDVVEGKLVGEWVSVPLRNEAAEWVKVVGVEGKDSFTKIVDYQLVRLAPGQSRPVKFRVKDIPVNSTRLEFVVRYNHEGERTQINLSVAKDLNSINHWYQPQKYTFLHPSGIVSYAVLRPPSPNASCQAVPENRLPILLSLHGAGVEADNPQSKESYSDLPHLCSWLVLPSGVTSWSGDDWHRWGFADVEAGIAAIPQWMQKVNWARQGIDLEKWVVSGHSNGGQGTWYILTHRSDKIIAAAPLSGYLSIPAYVPYHMWHEADPRKSAMILASLNTYKHELLTPNMLGTPILQQHGQDDDNVPVYHSRRMHQLIGEADWLTQYLEIPGQRHWWEGVMTDGELPRFLKRYLEEIPEIPDLTNRFSLVITNPADTGSRGGIVVDQLEEPDRIGRIDVERFGNTWKLVTSNVRRWHFEGPRAPRVDIPRRVIIDDQLLEVPGSSSNTFVFLESGVWTTTPDAHWKSIERSGRQWGALDAFLASEGEFSIVIPSRSEGYKMAVALDISRNLYQYFAADTDINNELHETEGNVVLVGSPPSGIRCGVEEFPISISETYVEISDVLRKTKRHKVEAGMGAIFICPLLRERLMLVLWGADEVGLRAASRLLPLRTGVGQPNFVLVGRESSWSGVCGAKALGMFDSKWRVSRASYI
ncbi:hypothetical protein BDD12DRAFT_872710 [Trichophaea hybrida]|nr:hypothetical protein BDD12DRAFT_872710 [Trichophaea hybrida]